MPIKRARPPLTHFLAIPLHNSSSVASLKASVSEFIKETTSAADPKAATAVHSTHRLAGSLGVEQTEDGHDPSNQMQTQAQATAGGTTDPRSRSSPWLPVGAVRPPSTLHLTLGVMSLTEPEQVDTAVSMLKNMDVRTLLETSTPATSASASGIASPDTSSQSSTAAGRSDELAPPITVQLKGLVPMQDADASTVLYAAPDDSSGRLRQFCEALKTRFAEERLLVPDKRELKLHATIVNTIYANGPRRAKHGRKEPLKINAQALIERWRDHVWAEVTLEKVVICEMGAKEDRDGVPHYHEIAEAPLI